MLIIISQTNASTKQLTLPLDPMDWRQFHIRGELRVPPSKPPMTGGVLVYALNLQAYRLWRDTANMQISRTERSTFPPYQYIEVDLVPQATYPFECTPVNMGIGLLLMIDNLFRGLSIWPGAIEYGVFEFTYDHPVGSIYVRNNLASTEGLSLNLPQRNTTDVTTLFGNNAQGLSVLSRLGSTGLQTNLGVVVGERNWLRCFCMLMWFVFKFAASQPVLAGLHPGMDYFWDDVPNMRYALGITGDMPPTLTWDQLATMLIMILKDWAIATNWHAMEHGKLFKDGRLVAEVSIGLRPPYTEDPGIATA